MMKLLAVLLGVHRLRAEVARLTRENEELNEECNILLEKLLRMSAREVI